MFHNFFICSSSIFSLNQVIYNSSYQLMSRYILNYLISMEKHIRTINFCKIMGAFPFCCQVFCFCCCLGRYLWRKIWPIFSMAICCQVFQFACDSQSFLYFPDFNIFNCLCFQIFLISDSLCFQLFQILS